MRIDLNAGIGTAQAKLDKTASARPPAAAAQVPAEADFSSASISVINLSARVMAAPEVREQKVEALRTQVQSGTYQVSSNQIVASMFDDMRVNA